MGRSEFTPGGGRETENKMKRGKEEVKGRWRGEGWQGRKESDITREASEGEQMAEGELK